jgi:hypothetical protein
VLWARDRGCALARRKRHEPAHSSTGGTVLRHWLVALAHTWRPACVVASSQGAGVLRGQRAKVGRWCNPGTSAVCWCPCERMHILLESGGVGSYEPVVSSCVTGDLQTGSPAVGTWTWRDDCPPCRGNGDCTAPCFFPRKYS